MALLTRKVQELGEQIEVCQRLQTIPGVGLLTATAMYAAVADANNFENGRQMSTWLDLVPKQHSTGGKARLLGISKRGDKYIRSLVMHGARAVVVAIKNKYTEKAKRIENLCMRLV